MKAVEPTIKIGANGPWDYKAIPIIEKLTPKERIKLRSLNSSKSRRAFIKKFKGGFIHNSSYQSWWKVLATKVPNDFDFAVIHRYTNLRKHDYDLNKPLQCGNAVKNLKRFLYHQTGYHYPIALTEYNVGRKSARNLSSVALKLTIAEMIGEYLRSGVKIANYWPLRYNEKRALFYLSQKPTPLYYIFKNIATHTGKFILKTKSDNPKIYSWSSLHKKDKSLDIFIINKSHTKKSIIIHIPFSMKIIYKKTFGKNMPKKGKEERYHFSVKTQDWQAIVNPLTFSQIHLEEK